MSAAGTKTRVRRAHFSCVVDGVEWRFRWDPAERALLGKVKHRRRVFRVDSDHLVDLVKGQSRLL